VPGYLPEVTAPLRNDAQRLEAEGMLLGIQESLVDLVARREVLSHRIRQRIEKGTLEEAEVLLRELQRLDTQEDFERRVQRRKQSLSSVDTRAQQKIDQLFADTRPLLGRFLNAARTEELQALLNKAKLEAN
jgi:hypothetical protein